MNNKQVFITKRCIDIILSLLILICAMPFMLIFTLLIKLTSPGPIFYRQLRVRKHDNELAHPMGKELNDSNFILYKFRTMNADAEKGHAIYPSDKHDPRVTTIGNFLRKTRLDELPNFINVIKGEMSIVGPRAERYEFLKKVEKDLPQVWERTRFVKPGITGLAQIHLSSDGSPKVSGCKLKGVIIEDGTAQGELSIRYKLYYDFAYLSRIESGFIPFLKTELYIIFMTPYIMFFKRNAI